MAEQIDIGGPSVVRAAAKNHPSVAIITSPEQYGQLTEALPAGGFTLEQRKALAAAAFVHTATYDVAVASWMGNVLTDSSDGDRVPGVGRRDVVEGRVAALRREQPWPRRAVPQRPRGRRHRPGRAAARQGDELQQLHRRRRRYRAAYDFAEPAVAIIKHANPCGIAVGADIAEATAAPTPATRSRRSARSSRRTVR